MVRVFPDQAPFGELDRIDVTEIGCPYDMTASTVNGFIFISDLQKKCLWVISAIDYTKKTQWMMAKQPNKLSVACNQNELIVVTKDEKTSQYHLYIYNLTNQQDGSTPRFFPLPTTISKCFHAVQLSTEVNNQKTYIISYEHKKDEVSRISEIIEDRESFTRTFSTDAFDPWSPFHMQIDQHNRIFIADHSNGNHKVFLLDHQSGEMEVLFNNVNNKVKDPARLCYVGNENKKILIVGQESNSGLTPPIPPSVIVLPVNCGGL